MPEHIPENWFKALAYGEHALREQATDADGEELTEQYREMAMALDSIWSYLLAEEHTGP